MKTKIVLLFALLSVVYVSFAQKSALTGTVIDKSSNEPIAYANVAIFNTDDSSLVSGTMTDDKGPIFS
jgi:hypothetical protein